MTFPILGGNGAVGGYSIDNSLRFNENDNPNLSRTPSASNRKTFTTSFWFKRSHLDSTAGSNFYLYSGGSDGNNFFGFLLNSSTDKAVIFDSVGGSNKYDLRPNRVFRDTSAWYHIVLIVDSTESTSSDRVKLYINGVKETSFSTETYPSLNQDFTQNSNVLHTIGAEYSGSLTSWYDGYITEYNFIDGQAKSPTDFGEFDSDSGIWKPKQYTGTYGTNGFYLDFENSGSLGADQSGNGNNFTPTNLTSTDQTTDTPTNNFATLNPLTETQSVANFSEGNTQIEGNTDTQGSAKSSIQIPSSGKWYIESEFDAIGGSGANAFGFVTESYTSHSIDSSGGRGVKASYSGGAGSRVIQIMNGSSQIGSNINVSAGIIMQLVIDQDNGKAWLGKDNTYYNSSGGTDGNPSTGSNPTFTFTVENFDVLFGVYQGGGGDGIQRQKVNFGNPSFSISSGNSDDNGYGNFEYAPPSGYLALCTQNLATELSPTIDDGSQYFNTVLYSGNGGTQSITGVGFQTDFSWFKSRSLTRTHLLINSNVGFTKVLQSNITNAEETTSKGITSVNSDGFTIEHDGTIPLNSFNENSANIVSWNWKCNAGTNVSNTDGSITSTVQANTTAGFSIVTFTGNGSNDATIGHGLGTTPAMIITKNRDDSINWRVWHKDLTSNYVLFLASTLAEIAPTGQSNGYIKTVNSSTYSVYQGNVDTNGVNGSGDDMIAYCFADIEGYSKAFSYTGNGNSDSTFIYLGFRPQWVLMKKSSDSGIWFIYDEKRDVDNKVHHRLLANDSQAENTGSGDDIDFVSNGIKVRSSASAINASGATFIGFAIASNPFVTSSGVPVTAR